MAASDLAPPPVGLTPTFTQALLAGGAAGTAVDTALFPLDTIKTRLQAKGGFWAHGGFKGIYRGLSSAVIGSAPGAAAFFVTYEAIKERAGIWLPGLKSTDAAVHMLAASGGEVAACFVRVPTEVIKQRMQTGQYQSVVQAVRSILAVDGLGGFYRGYAMTIFREIPFTCIQFPLYERLKQIWAQKTNRQSVNAGEAALCGSVSGGIAAALTTPLDVVKTRIMLGTKSITPTTQTISPGILPTFTSIIREEGAGRLFAGVGPRVMWISIGGSIFLGVYEGAKDFLVRV
ncbi:mitochondrial carrier domain-containing protein [Fimicolochytrium jonesii]|uniref:mitochondrial carrier domain-containing protein n=1 Tax=Fimicolochytrium jonesii TaxID=1396493 RepID=UPI0022FDD159|nr:mitochondrial carrier domain-containing protein [Fimicolochytrium jonesii]KAI8820861.1 mitochondrial carrier domain-containing protein [Fimicolochytrium jonesii]